MKKALIILLTALLSFGLLACGKGDNKIENDSSAQTDNLPGMINPWTDHPSLKDAEGEIGFKLSLSETIADSYKAKNYRTMAGENPILEIFYFSGDLRVDVRKALGENLDISGVYGYDVCTTTEVNGETVNIYRMEQSDSEEVPINITINHDGFSWSIFASDGFLQGTMNEFINSILSLG